MGLHAVCAEKGGDALVKEKLKNEGLDLAFPVHSDPDCKLLANSSSEIYVQNRVDESREYYLKGVQETEVQPAVVVADPTGQVTQWWSWRKFLNEGQLESVRPGSEWHLKRKAEGREFDPGALRLKKLRKTGGEEHQEARDMMIKILDRAIETIYSLPGIQDEQRPFCLLL